MKYAVVLPSGAILQTGNVANAEDVALQGGLLLSVEAPDSVTDGTHFYDHSEGVFVEYPARPNDRVTFDFTTMEWRDLRTVEQKAADLDRARQAAIAAVNQWAGKQRMQFITDVAGQDMIYTAKEAEAIRWVLEQPDKSDMTEYPFIAAEIGVLAATPLEVAQIWINMAHIWRQEAARTEAIRVKANADIRAAETEDAIEVIITFGLTADIQ